MALHCLVSGQWRGLKVGRTHLVLRDSTTKNIYHYKDLLLTDRLIPCFFIRYCMMTFFFQLPAAKTNNTLITSTANDGAHAPSRKLIGRPISCAIE